MLVLLYRNINRLFVESASHFNAILNSQSSYKNWAHAFQRIVGKLFKGKHIHTNRFVAASLWQKCAQLVISPHTLPNRYTLPHSHTGSSIRNSEYRKNSKWCLSKQKETASKQNEYEKRKERWKKTVTNVVCYF